MGYLIVGMFLMALGLSVAIWKYRGIEQRSPPQLLPHTHTHEHEGGVKHSHLHLHS
jgi:hypothetical protein